MNVKIPPCVEPRQNEVILMNKFLLVLFEATKTPGLYVILICRKSFVSYLSIFFIRIGLILLREWILKFIWKWIVCDIDIRKRIYSNIHVRMRSCGRVVSMIIENSFILTNHFYMAFKRVICGCFYAYNWRW